MELLATLLLLYLVQCGIFLPRESTLFTRFLRRWRIRGGPGWSLLPVLPSARWIHARRPPLRLVDGQLRTRSAPSRFDWHGLEPGAVALGPGADAKVEVAGKRVRVEGRAIYRAHEKRAARRMAQLLRSLAAASENERLRHIEAELTRSLSLPAFREALLRFDAATRVLGWLCDLYLVLLFAGVPLAILLVHEENGLRLSFMAIAVLHTTTLLALWRAGRQLRLAGLEGEDGEHFERLFAAAVYPPSLLRSPGELRLELLGDYHPAVAAAALLPPAQSRRFLRADLLRLEHEAEATGPRDAVCELERRALLGLIAECGETRESLMTPPPREDPAASSYCPICAADYVRAQGRCTDCGVDLLPYPA